MSTRYTAVLTVPEWITEVPEAMKRITDYFGEPEWWDAYHVERSDGVISFTDNEASYGEFPELEEFLQKNGIPFDRWTEGYSDQPPYCLEFRPELKKPVYSNGDGSHSVNCEILQKLLDDPQCDIRSELQKLMPPKVKELWDYTEIPKHLKKEASRDVGR